MRSFLALAATSPSLPGRSLPPSEQGQLSLMNVRTIATTAAILSVLSLASNRDAEASSFRLLHGNSMAMQARIDLIQRAESSIDLAYYGLDTGEVPVAILELLRQASQRGVRVRLVVDGFYGKMPAGLCKYLERCGIQIRDYHVNNRLDPTWINQRIHSKLLVVDSTIAIIGSRNMQDEHFGLGEDRNYIDCDALISGEVAVQGQSYFRWLWQLPDLEPTRHGIPACLKMCKLRPRGGSDWNKAWRRAKSPRDYQHLLSQSLQRVTCRLDVELNSDVDLLADSIFGLQIRLLTDCKTDKSSGRFQREVVRMMDCANRCVKFESPYPAFHPNVRSAISRARSRGVSVTILTNSLESTNVLGAYAAYQNQKRSLLREGVRLREFCGKDTLHAKTMVVDHSTWMLGSYNFDARSDKSNLELCIVSDCPVGAAMLDSDIQSRVANSTRMMPGKVFLPVGGHPSLSKRSKMILRRVVVESYRGLL
jgi:putative cardiolipin synthase